MCYRHRCGNLVTLYMRFGVSLDSPLGQVKEFRAANERRDLRKMDALLLTSQARTAVTRALQVEGGPAGSHLGLGEDQLARLLLVTAVPA